MMNKFKRWAKRFNKHLEQKTTQKKLLRVLGILVLVWLISCWLLIWNYQNKYRNTPTEFGVSFSTKYSTDLGLNWQENYHALIDDLDVNFIRVMSYWDTIEKHPNDFNYDNLDYQFDYAAQKGVKLSLVLGERQPRWPECHTPEWANTLEKEEFKSELLSFIERTVLRYKDHPALENYQLENEFANQLFGECSGYDRERLQEEFNLVKSLDPRHDVIINASNQSGIPLREPIGDKVGFSIYKRAHYPLGDSVNMWHFFYVPNWWHTLRASLVEFIHNKPTFVHELQAEPWGPKETYNLSLEEQAETMDPQKLVEIVGFAESTGMSRIYLWGGEWWYWRMVEFDDPSLWNTVKALKLKYEN